MTMTEEVKPMNQRSDELLELKESRDTKEDIFTRELLSSPIDETQIKLPQKPLVSLPLAVVIIGFAFFLAGYSTPILKIFPQTEQIESKENKDFFSDLELTARAVYVYDIEADKVLYSYNESEVLPLASLTKLMSAIIAKESLPHDAIVTINADNIRTEGDSGLLVGERWKLGDIIGFTLMTSSNDGAAAIVGAAGSLGQNAFAQSEETARKEFIQKMNSKSQEIGLRGTYFFNGTGLDISEVISGGYGTAKDVAVLMSYAVRTIYDNLSLTALSHTTIHSLANVGHVSTNTNEYVGLIPNMIASKTGYTDLAGGNLVIVFNAGLMRPVVISVLGSTREGRFEDVEKLAWAVLEYLATEPVN